MGKIVRLSTRIFFPFSSSSVSSKNEKGGGGGPRRIMMDVSWSETEAYQKILWRCVSVSRCDLLFWFFCSDVSFFWRRLAPLWLLSSRFFLPCESRRDGSMAIRYNIRFVKKKPQPVISFPKQTLQAECKRGETLAICCSLSCSTMELYIQSCPFKYANLENNKLGQNGWTFLDGTGKTKKYRSFLVVCCFKKQPPLLLDLKQEQTLFKDLLGQDIG